MGEAFKVKSASDIHQGLPPLETENNNSNNKTTSFFEFWPSQVIYIPVVLQWLWLSLRYRSLSLPLIANPSIHLSGMVGESKSEVLKLAGKQALKHIAPYITLQNDSAQGIDARLQSALNGMQQSNLSFPIIAKPDIGCRGAGVQIINDAQALKRYISVFPDKAKYLLQHKVQYEAEAGIFYIREPGQKKGQIFSITLKYMPYVIGNGSLKLAQLIENDPRAKKIADVYLKRHKDELDKIIPNNIAFRLSFAGSHCKGSIFRNGNQYITSTLCEKFDDITHDITEFYYGRFDVRFASIDKLMLGEDFEILEVNGASSEATHIWDRKTKLYDVYKTLFYQYKTLFNIGHLNRKQGHKTPSILLLLKAWKKESRLVKQYPETD